MDGNTLDSEIEYLTKRYVAGQDIPVKSVSNQALSAMTVNLNNHCSNSFQANKMDSVARGLDSWSNVLLDYESQMPDESYHGFVRMSISSMVRNTAVADTGMLDLNYSSLKSVVEMYADESGKSKIVDVHAHMKSMSEMQLGPLYKEFVQVNQDIKAFRGKLAEKGIKVGKKQAVEIVKDYISMSTDLLNMTDSYTPGAVQDLANYMHVLSADPKVFDKSGELRNKVNSLLSESITIIYRNPGFPVDVRIQHFDYIARNVPEDKRQAFLDHEQDQHYTAVEQAAKSGNKALLDVQWNMFEEFSKKYIPDDDDISLQREKKKFYIN